MIRTSLLLFKKKPKPGEQAGLQRRLFGAASDMLFDMVPSYMPVRKLARSFGSSAISSDAAGFSGVVRSELESKIISITRSFLKDIKHSKPNRLTPNATFSSLGLDSLDSI